MTDQQKGIWIGNFPCPSCSSSDANAVYLKENEHGEYYDANCFSCNTYFTHNQLVESGVMSGDFKVDKENLPKPKERITKEEYKELCSRTNFNGTMKDGSQYRGIRNDVLEFYGHRIERDKAGDIVAVYYPETVDGKAWGFKSRVLPKKFGWRNVGKTGLGSDLSGEHKFQSGGKYILIASGEEDKCAAFQMLRDYQISKNQGDYDPYAVVGVTTGEGSGAKQCANRYEFLDSFENIIICMDNDDAGRRASEEIVKVLPKDKVKVMTTSGKDANSMLLDGRQKQFISNFFDAKEVNATGIKSSKDLMADVEEVLMATPITLPPYMHKLQSAMKRAFSTNGRVVNWIGKSSVGKSTHVNAMVYHWAMSPVMKPLVISLEMTGGEYAIDLLSLHLGKNLDWFDEGKDAVDYLNHEDVKPLYADLMQDEFGEERFKIVDEGVTSLEVIEKQIDRAVKQYGCNIVIIDVLSDLLRFLPIADQEKHMAWQKNFVKSGVSIVNVLHTKKVEKDKDGKERLTTEYDALGSSSFVQSAHINIVLNRDKMATDLMERNTTIVDMPKCRRGTTGRITDWVYDIKTRQVYDKEDYLNMIHEKPEDSIVQSSVNDPEIEEISNEPEF